MLNALDHACPSHYRVVKGGGVPRGGGSLIFPKVPQSSLGILKVPQVPPPLEHPPPLGTLQSHVENLLGDCSMSWLAKRDPYNFVMAGRIYN